MDDGEQTVKVAFPTTDDVGFGAETAHAVHVGADRYRVENVLAWTDGVSGGDIVRVDVAADGTLVAVEVLERSDDVTVVFSTVDKLPDVDARLRAFHKSLAESSLRKRIAVEGMSLSGRGIEVMAVQWPLAKAREFWFRVEDAVRDAFPGTTPDHDPEAQTVGPMGYWVVADPSWDAPEMIDGADYLLASYAEQAERDGVVAVSWPDPGDDVAGEWPAEFVDRLVEQATTDARLRKMMDRRLYLPMVAIQLRVGAMQSGVTLKQMGPPPYVLGAYGDDDGAPDPDEVSALWREARSEGGGEVRWAHDPEVDRMFRERFMALGIDPDADPTQPVTVRVGSSGGQTTE